MVTSCISLPLQREVKITQFLIAPYPPQLHFSLSYLLRFTIGTNIAVHCGSFWHPHVRMRVFGFLPQKHSGETGWFRRTVQLIKKHKNSFVCLFVCVQFLHVAKAVLEFHTNSDCLVSELGSSLRPLSMCSIPRLNISPCSSTHLVLNL